MSHGGSATAATLADRIREIPGCEHLARCFSCGTCVSRCLIQQRLESTYNPRRLFHKAMLGLDQLAFDDKTTWLCSACDLCYPACPQEIHVSDVIAAIRELAKQSGRSSSLAVAVVNEQTCVACGLCVEVCPYEAVALVDIPVGRDRTKSVARVDPNRCMACGLCAASCRSTSIGLPDEFSNESLLQDLWDWLGQPESTSSPTAEVAE
jgi:heterodisulfide reductase subunit C